MSIFLARALKLQRFFLLTATASADSDCFISHCNALQCVLHVRSVQNSISTSRFGTIYLPSMCFGWDLVGLDQAREDLLNSQCIIIYKLKWPTRFSTWCCVIICIGTGRKFIKCSGAPKLYFSFMYLYTILFHLAFWGPTKKRWCWKITGRKLALTVLGFMTKA